LESTDERDLILSQRRHASTPRSNVMNPAHNSPPSDARSKGTKRKRNEAQSTNSSYQVTSRRTKALPVDVDSGDEQTTKRRAVLSSKPPKKKRRIASGSEESPPLTHKGKKKIQDVRNGSGGLQTPVASNDEEEGEEEEDGAVVKEHLRRFDEDEEKVEVEVEVEEEEGMIEDAIPDGYHSAGRNDPDNNSRNNAFEVDSVNGNLEGKQNIHDLREEEEEESDEVEFLESPRPPTRSKAAPTPRLKGPGPRIMQQPPPPHWKTSPSSKHRRQLPAGVPTLGSNKTRPAATIKKSNESSINRNSKSRPLFEPSLDSDRSPTPEWHRKPQQKPAKKHPRIASLDVLSIQDSDDSDTDVSLSDGAWQRLALFDAEVIGKKMRVVEKKRVKEMNGKGELSSSNRSSGNSRPAAVVRPTSRFDTQSYNMDVVPETELENSQEDKLLTPSIAVKSHENRNDVSIMAPSIPGPSTTKSLRPLPRISPSTFRAHLQPPNSSLPDTIIEPSSSLERRPEIEAIEQFESPEKDHGLSTKTVVLKKNGLLMDAGKEPTANQRESAKDAWGSEFVRRRQEIAEQDRVSALGGPESSPKVMMMKSVQEVVARAESRRRSESNASQPDENDDDDDERQQPEEEGVANASTSVVPPASGPPALSEEQPPPIDDMSIPMQDDLVDLNGDVGVGETGDVDITHDDIDGTPAGIDPELLRQEEEENTQDIMSHRQHREQEEEMMRINDEDRDVSPSPVCASSIPRDTGGPIALVLAEVSHLSLLLRTTI